MILARTVVVRGKPHLRVLYRTAYCVEYIYLHEIVRQRCHIRFKLVPCNMYEFLMRVTEGNTTVSLRYVKLALGFF